MSASAFPIRRLRRSWCAPRAGRRIFSHSSRRAMPFHGSSAHSPEGRRVSTSPRGGKLGIETVTPTQQLHVNHNSGLRVNHLFMSGGLGGVADRWSSIAYNAHHDDANNAWVFDDTARRSVTIEMDDAWGFPRFEAWSTATASTQA